MEEVLGVALGILSLAVVAEGLSEGVLSTLPFMDDLGKYQELAKRSFVLVVALALVFGFSIDLSTEIMHSEPITPVVGQILTATVIAFGSSLIHKAVKK